ncbi:MAG TPA: PEGA domain-containing protein [Polyangiaceae bacterium]
MRNHTKGRWLSFVCTIALLSGTTLAPAQQPAAGAARGTEAVGERKPLAESLTGVARAEYEAGRILYMDGDYQTAVVKFERAYQESKDPRLLWNMAAAEKNLRHYVRVEELVRRYLDESGAQLTETERADAQVLLDTVSQFIGDVTIKVQPDGSSVAVDGAAVGVTPLPKPVRLEIGTRLLEIKKDGFVPQRESFQISGGSQLLEFNLEQELHQGTLRILADPGNIIHVDGKVVGTTEWQGTLASGAHNVHVTADGFRPYRSDTVVQDNQTTTLRITLQEDARPLGAMSPEDSKNDYMWAWIAGGAVVVSGLAIGSYYLFRPEDSGPPAPVDGTLGTIELPFGF